MKRIIFIVITLWAIIALVRILNNYHNLFFDEQIFFTSTEEEKRYLLFPCYPLVKFFLNGNIKTGTILYKNNDGFCFFTLRYYIYPLHVTWDNSVNSNLQGYTYIITNSQNQLTDKTLVFKKKVNTELFFVYK